MKKLLYSLTLILLTSTVYAQQSTPAVVAAPASVKLTLHVYAKGVQVYQCTQDPKDTSHYVWTFKEPKATLYSAADYKQAVGKHYLSSAKKPTWELSDGSLISGIKLQQAAAPDSNSIPWLILTGVPETGKGSLANVLFIQRLYTKDGQPPKTADQSQKEQTLEVPYTAEYLFYK